MVIDARDRFAKRMAATLMSPSLVVANGRTREQEVEARTDHLSQDDQDGVLLQLAIHYGVEV